MKGAKTVDEFVSSQERFADLVGELRAALVATPLAETVKWGAPCYTYEGKNVVTIGAFKNHCALWFHLGALMSDEGARFEDPEAVNSKAKAMRQWRFGEDDEVDAGEIASYVDEAIELVESGAKVSPEKKTGVDVPPELEAALAKSAPARKAFAALTPGKQREYAAHVAEAKQAATKARRVEKILPMIREGVGLHDRYRNC